MKKRSRRFADRSVEFFDVVQRFEAKSSSDHGRVAQGAIERLMQEGSSFWSEDQRQLKRWQDYCNVLWNFIVTDLGNRRFNQKQDLETALREFIGEFEHSTHGMFEMLHGTSEDADSDPSIRNILAWFELVYRSSTYAILSCWIDEKHEHKSTAIDISVTPDGRPRMDIRETVVHREMRKPKNPMHRRAMNKL
ncbi:hypothetical protein F4212_06380 [Candidatus Poribacteria bacterium]|nr:hypothetical protein [Candidatus Poribacteria bacterium]